MLIKRLLFSAECAFTVVLFLALLIYFPAKPPTAPSVSASTARLSYKTGFRVLVRLVCRENSIFDYAYKHLLSTLEIPLNAVFWDWFPRCRIFGRCRNLATIIESSFCGPCHKSEVVPVSISLSIRWNQYGLHKGSMWEHGSFMGSM